MKDYRAVVGLVAVVLFFWSHPVEAQDGPPEIPDATAVFHASVSSFEAGDYETALDGFRRVTDEFPLNTKTTAALLMAGKSLYRAGQFEQAALALEYFVQRFPESRYSDDARVTIRYARDALGDSDGVLPRLLGVLLPTSTDDLSLTQAIFNGIRLAVDGHNASGNGRSPLRMVFRRSDDGHIEEVIREFAEMGVEVVIGPLYSREAIEAAEVAERNRVVLITPLATDERVARGKQFVFQANPTGTMRGRAMARFAVENLRHSQLGLIAEDGNELSERMAEGFEQEVHRLGAELRFLIMLPSATGWFRLGDRLVADSLTGTQAIYLPITGGQARSLIKAAMDEFDNLGVQLRLLGNKEWHDLPSKMQPSRYNAVYTNDFHVSTTDTRTVDFVSEYEVLAEAKPNELAYVGYDLAQFIAYLITSGSDQPLQEALTRAAPYSGLALRLDFTGGNVNQAMFFERYRNGQSELLY